jgi:hypothetical protein
MSPREACQQVRASVKDVDPAILAALSDPHLQMPMQIRECNVRDLAVGMILQQDLYMGTGALIAAKGFELSHAWIERLETYARRNVISGRIKVQMPQRHFQ